MASKQQLEHAILEQRIKNLENIIKRQSVQVGDYIEVRSQEVEAEQTQYMMTQNQLGISRVESMTFDRIQREINSGRSNSKGRHVRDQSFNTIQYDRPDEFAHFDDIMSNEDHHDEKSSLSQSQLDMSKFRNIHPNRVPRNSNLPNRTTMPSSFGNRSMIGNIGKKYSNKALHKKTNSLNFFKNKDFGLNTNKNLHLALSQNNQIYNKNSAFRNYNNSNLNRALTPVYQVRTNVANELSHSAVRVSLPTEQNEPMVKPLTSESSELGRKIMNFNKRFFSGVPKTKQKSKPGESRTNSCLPIKQQSVINIPYIQEETSFCEDDFEIDGPHETSNAISEIPRVSGKTNAKVSVYDQNGSIYPKSSQISFSEELSHLRTPVKLFEKETPQFQKKNDKKLIHPFQMSIDNGIKRLKQKYGDAFES